MRIYCDFFLMRKLWWGKKLADKVISIKRTYFFPLLFVILACDYIQFIPLSGKFSCFYVQGVFLIILKCGLRDEMLEKLTRIKNSKAG